MADEEPKHKSRASPAAQFARAMALAKDPAADIGNLRFAADTLVAFGALDEADAVMDRLERNNALVGLRHLRAVSRHLRRSGVLANYRAIAANSDGEAGPQEVLISQAKATTDRLILVFSGRAKRFWISLELLDRFLQPFGAHVVYLTDHSDTMYFNGLPSTAPGYATMIEFVHKTATEIGARRLFVMASSGGGFIGLRAAADLNAEAFLGLSIRTDFSGGDGALKNDFTAKILGKAADGSLLIDLRPYVEAREFPRRTLLFCGDGHPIDVAHADHMRGVRGVEVVRLPRYEQHDVVQGLLARGQFELVLRRFLGEGARVP